MPTTNVNVNVTAPRRNATDSDLSHVSQDSLSYPEEESSATTSPLEQPDDLPFRQKVQPRSTPRNPSASRSRPHSVVEDIYEDEEDDDEDFPGPIGPPTTIPGPAPEAPTARSQRPIHPASREASEDRDPGRREAPRREVSKRHSHKKHSHRRRRSPSEASTEDIMDPRGFQNEHGQWVEHPTQYPYPYAHLPQQQYTAAQSNHPGALVPANQFNPQAAMFQQQYPQQQPFYPPQMPISPMSMMGMPNYFGYNMMGMPPQMGAPAESAELLRLRQADEDRRNAEKRAYEDAERARQRKEDDRKDRIDRERATDAAVTKAVNDFKIAEAEKAAHRQAIEDAKAEAKKAADEESTTKAKEKEEEHKKKLDEATKKAEEAKKKEDDAKKELKEVKGPADNDKKVNIELCAANMKSKKFNIPWTYSKSWKTLYPLLVDAYARCDERIGPYLATRMDDGAFEIQDSTGTTIMEKTWDIVIKPDASVRIFVRMPEPQHHHVPAHHAPHHKSSKPKHDGVHRSKSKSKKRQSGLWGEQPQQMAGAGPPPPPMAPMVPMGGGMMPMPMGGEIPDDPNEIVQVVDDGSMGSSDKPRKSKKNPPKQPGLLSLWMGSGKKR